MTAVDVEGATPFTRIPDLDLRRIAQPTLVVNGVDDVVARGAQRLRPYE